MSVLQPMIHFYIILAEVNHPLRLLYLRGFELTPPQRS